VPRTRPPYPPEFRAEAVRLIRSSGKPLSEIPKDLGLSEQSLRVWIKQADLDEGRRDDRLTTSELEELRRLRLHPDLVRLAVSGRGPRPLVTPSRGLGDGRPAVASAARRVSWWRANRWTSRSTCAFGGMGHAGY
jgi:transposase